MRHTLSRLRSKYIERIKQAVEKLNLGYLIFMRTGQLAAKHSYERTVIIFRTELQKIFIQVMFIHV